MRNLFNPGSGMEKFGSRITYRDQNTHTHTSNSSKPTIKNEIYNRFFLPVGVKWGSDVLIVAGIRIGGGWSGTGGRRPTPQRQILNGEGAADRGGHLLVQPLLVLKDNQGLFILKNAGKL
jgi:hypothetical protein